MHQNKEIESELEIEEKAWKLFREDENSELIQNAYEKLSVYKEARLLKNLFILFCTG